jgi:hypothetical protein
LFSVEAFLDNRLGRSASSLTQFHLQKTLRLLQDRLGVADDSQATADATIMVVSVLALTAELHGDLAAAEVHLKGLWRMVSLRGGLEMLRFENSRLPAKVCRSVSGIGVETYIILTRARVDLGIALRFGQRPLFFSDKMAWDPFIDLKDLVKGKVKDTDGPVARFFESAQDKMSHVWTDLRAFCHLCNLASQTSHKLLPNTFSEVMASVLYRLVALSFDTARMEVLRLAMIVFASQIFLQWREMRLRQVQLDHDLREALLQLHTEGDTDVPPCVIFWALIIWQTSLTERSDDDCLTVWLKSTARQLGLDSWKDAKEALKSVLWIDVFHDAALVELFDSWCGADTRHIPKNNTAH